MQQRFQTEFKSQMLLLYTLGNRSAKTAVKGPLNSNSPLSLPESLPKSMFIQIVGCIIHHKMNKKYIRFHEIIKLTRPKVNLH